MAALPMCWPLKSSSICLSINGREGSAVRGLAGSAIEFLQRGTTLEQRQPVALPPPFSGVSSLDLGLLPQASGPFSFLVRVLGSRRFEVGVIAAVLIVPI